MSAGAEILSCWKCGAPLRIPLPIGRRDDCPSCHADLHVCLQCGFYDLHAAKSCRETMADETSDKERGNFCDYFRPTSRGLADSSQADAAKAKLDALFGANAARGNVLGGGAFGGGAFGEKEAAGKPLSGTTALEREAAGQAAKAQDEAAASREKLERLFGKKN